MDSDRKIGFLMPSFSIATSLRSLQNWLVAITWHETFFSSTFKSKLYVFDDVKLRKFFKKIEPKIDTFHFFFLVRILVLDVSMPIEKCNKSIFAFTDERYRGRRLARMQLSFCFVIFSSSLQTSNFFDYGKIRNIRNLRRNFLYH